MKFWNFDFFYARSVGGASRGAGVGVFWGEHQVSLVSKISGENLNEKKRIFFKNPDFFSKFLKFRKFWFFNRIFSIKIFSTEKSVSKDFRSSFFLHFSSRHLFFGFFSLDKILLIWRQTMHLGASMWCLLLISAAPGGPWGYIWDKVDFQLRTLSIKDNSQNK